MASPRRKWTPEEVKRLYRYAETVSQRRAARLLGRTWQSVAAKARTMGIRWRQGTWSYWAIAAEVGCSPSTVKRAAEILVPDGVPSVGSGAGTRALLDYDDGIRVIDLLRRTRVFRANKIRAGKASRKRSFS